MIFIYPTYSIIFRKNLNDGTTVNFAKFYILRVMKMFKRKVPLKYSEFSLHYSIILHSTFGMKTQFLRNVIPYGWFDNKIKSSTKLRLY